MNKVIIDVDNLTKIYKMYENPIDRLKESIHPFRKKYHKDFYALNNISFQVNEGDILAIIGKNGAGKSTLLKMITGVLNPTSGTIKVNGNVSAILELGAGFNPELSGLENIYFNGMILGKSKEEIDSKLDEILTFAEIGDHIYQPVKTYSSGMFVRLAFSVAVSVNPEILIVDEALAVGDVRFRQRAIRKMKELMDQAKAILFVTHDMESVKNFCNDVIWIMDGKVYKRGKPKDIIQQYYNFMTHNILPETTSDSVIDKKIPREELLSNETNNFIWKTVADVEIIGSKEVVALRRVAFVNNLSGENIEILNGTESKVSFMADIEIFEEVLNPIIGFGIFNQYGVAVLHFNSRNINCREAGALLKGERIQVEFTFKMPRLQSGNYSISLGVNDGDLDNNTIVQHMRECYLFKVVIQGPESRQYGMVIAEEAEIKVSSSDVSKGK
ncbi:ABC transporter ATP-binding protein [Paenibacillus sp. YYML68]|uniref:ABC transporter ATP-binding protein n=1 Tax=Paenibacillus sp. YYML68 TaxID=2909250 RepID=UPI002490BE32|nr:ABC transporter ATP-binding protein [Paenibacillus sp. YYML68]